MQIRQNTKSGSIKQRFKRQTQAFVVVITIITTYFTHNPLFYYMGEIKVAYTTQQIK